MPAALLLLEPVNINIIEGYQSNETDKPAVNKNTKKLYIYIYYNCNMMNIQHCMQVNEVSLSITYGIWHVSVQAHASVEAFLMNTNSSACYACVAGCFSTQGIRYYS